MSEDPRVTASKREAKLAGQVRDLLDETDRLAAGIAEKDATIERLRATVRYVRDHLASVPEWERPGWELSRMVSMLTAALEPSLNEALAP